MKKYIMDYCYSFDHFIWEVNKCEGMDECEVIDVKGWMNLK
jgi:hypothetical protein